MFPGSQLEEVSESGKEETVSGKGTWETEWQ